LTSSKRGPFDRLGGADGRGNLLATLSPPSSTPYCSTIGVRPAPGIDGIDLLAPRVDTDHLVAVTRKAGRGDDVHIAEAEDCNPHDYLHRRTPASA
jgi:hypothetical protein